MNPAFEKMSTTNISKFETAMKENEELLNMNINMNIEKLKSKSSSSINNTVYNINSNNYPSYYNQPSADINKYILLKSPYFHSHASKFTKHL